MLPLKFGNIMYQARIIITSGHGLQNAN